MKRVGLLALCVAVCLGTGLGLTQNAAGAQSGESITSMAVDVTINRDGSVDVTERIQYDFGSNQRRGIFRAIPVRFPYQPRDSTGRIIDDNRSYERQTPISGFRVTSPDAPADVSSESQGDVESFRIGNPDTYVSGIKNYEIRYRLGSVLNGFGDHDELYLNATGNRWEVPIQASAMTVTAPGSPNRVTCYAGPEGSNQPCDSAEIVNEAASFSQGSLGVAEGVTVVVALPKGVVDEPKPDIVELWSVRRAFDPSALKLGLGALLALGGVAGIGSLLWRNGRDRRFVGGATDQAFGNVTGIEEPKPLRDSTAIPVEFVPPDGIRPGAMGTLWDEVAHPLDVSAMIVDLAVRGYLRIDETEPPSASGAGGEYRFVSLRPADDELAHAEEVLLAALFQGGSPVDLAELRAHFSERLALVEGALYDDAVAAGWFPTRPDRVRARWRGIGLGAMVLGGGLTFLAARFTSWGLVVLPLPFLGLALAALAGRFPRRTARGTALLGRTIGFKQLFDVGEGERQRFLEDTGAFSRYLPYAMVFGCTEMWAKTFADLGVTPEQMGLGTWYTSPYRLDPIMFGWAMGRFATTTTGSIAMAAPSSVSTSGAGGGFSGFGGGFSGGGFGGGGGGSW